MSAQELRELDAWIAEHVMGWVDVELHAPSFSPIEDAFEQDPFYRGHSPSFDLWLEVPGYSTGASAAMEVLKKCLKSDKRFGGIMLFDSQASSVTCFTVMAGAIGNLKVQAETIELAICLFAKALFKK